MPYYVYILKSDRDGSYYKGYTEDFTMRLQQHNASQSKYTSRKIPWRIVYVEIYDSKREALMREKAIKKYSHAQIMALITMYGACRNLSSQE